MQDPYLPPGVTQSMIDAHYGWDCDEDEEPQQIVNVTVHITSPAGEHSVDHSVLYEYGCWHALPSYCESIGLAARQAAAAAAESAAARGDSSASVTVTPEMIAGARATIATLARAGGLDVTDAVLDSLGPF